MKAKLVATRRQHVLTATFPASYVFNYTYDAFVAVSNEIKNGMIEKKINPNKIHVIFNGTPRDKYIEAENELSPQIKQQVEGVLPSQRFVIGCVSRLKHQIQLARAIEKLDFPVTVVFLGIDEIPDYDCKKLETLGHQVILFDFIPFPDSIRFYKYFDVAVLPSTSEGFSQAILEAMYLSVPVIATRAMGNIDQVDHGVTGLLFENDDTAALAKNLAELHKNPEIRKSLAKRAKEKVESTFLIDQVITNYERFFTELIDS
jgi:glycosyltransferase involved in cell wall biosynthesis